jgi:methylmalonyl-CoA mutase
MAGKPPEEKERLFAAGLDSFIYAGVNVLEMLKSYQRKTGVQ